MKKTTSELVSIAANILEEENYTDAASLTVHLLELDSKFFRDETTTHNIAVEAFKHLDSRLNFELHHTFRAECGYGA